MEQINLAQFAYEAFCLMHTRFLDGQPAPPAWELLSTKEHAAWTYAVDKGENFLRDLYTQRAHT